jgi:hypothetical protein
MKLRQNGTVSFLIRLAVFLARGGALMKHCQKFLLRSDWTLAASGGDRMKLHKIQCHLGSD